jgi:hypothetical protein
MRRSGPVKARPAPLASSMTVNDAFRAVVAAGLVHLLANERGLRESADPEYLHQARVALRRLRSALEVFSPPLPETVVAPVERELGWLASRLGPARDWDVLLTETLPPIEAEFGAQRGLKAFGTRCGRLRRSAGARARRAVRSARYRRLTLWLSAGWAEGWRARRTAPPCWPAEPGGRSCPEGAGGALPSVRARGRGPTRYRPLTCTACASRSRSSVTPIFSGLHWGDRCTKRQAPSRLQDILAQRAMRQRRPIWWYGFTAGGRPGTSSKPEACCWAGTARGWRS